MNNTSILDYLRDHLKKLQEKLEKITYEKGMAAEENKDLRENFAYDYWVQQENNVMVKINEVIAEIYRISGKKPTKPKGIKPKAIQKVKDLPKKKWL